MAVPAGGRKFTTFGRGNMPGQASKVNQPSIISDQLARRRLLAKAFARGSAAGLLRGKAATAASSDQCHACHAEAQRLRNESELALNF